MKTFILTAAFALTVISLAACGKSANNNAPANASSSPANMNGVNHNGTNHDMTNHNGMDHSNMNHNQMTGHSEMKSDQDAAGAPFDLQFIDTMTLHHEGAVQMSQMILLKSQNEELKKFAQKIIDDQMREIAVMKQWREQWYPGRQPAKNMEMPGMKDSMKMMSGDEMKKMEAATGKEFDLRFLEMMTAHHAGAVTMAKDALGKAEHAEIKTLAQSIIMAQEAEIEMMRNWKTQWSK